MEAVKDSPQTAAPKKILLQAMVDRDIAYQFKNLVASHKMTIQQGLGWAIRSLLVQAGIKTRRDRGERHIAADSEGALQLAESDGERAEKSIANAGNSGGCVSP